VRLKVTHFVEKPSTFVSTLISCGIYLFSPELFDHIGSVFRRNQEDVTYVTLHTTLAAEFTVLKVKRLQLFMENPPQRYRASSAVWDHTLLPATRHRWTHPASPLARLASTRCIYPVGMEGWVDLAVGYTSRIELVYLSANIHPSK